MGYACLLPLNRSAMAALVAPQFSDYLKDPETSTSSAVFDHSMQSGPHVVDTAFAVVARAVRLLVTL